MAISGILVEKVNYFVQNIRQTIPSMPFVMAELWPMQAQTKSQYCPLIQNHPDHNVTQHRFHAYNMPSLYSIRLAFRLSELNKDVSELCRELSVNVGDEMRGSSVLVFKTREYKCRLNQLSWNGWQSNFWICWLGRVYHPVSTLAATWDAHVKDIG